MTETRSTCPYCGVGCGVVIESDGGQITGVRGDSDHPANFGRLCSKGSALALTASAPITLHQRLHLPQRRGPVGLQPVGWDDALDEAADRFAGIVTAHGPDAIAFYLSGQLLTEDYYVYNKIAKGLIGTNNVDTNSRLCMSSAVAGYKLTLGADAPPCSYEDLDHASVVFIVGSNMAWAHPVLFRRLEDAKRARPGLKIIVADPRRTETAAFADLHLPLLPGTDVALFHGMLHLMLWEGRTDPAYIAAHTSGIGALRDRVRDFTPKEVARLCGIEEAALVQAARWFANVDDTTGTRGPTLSLYCQGLNQSSAGTAKNATLINLHLATGQIGRPGAGPFSLTGQPNAMGGREVGGLANLLSAHRDLANAEHRAEVARLWCVDDVPATPGKTAVEMFQAAADGQIKALWIACTNPAQSMPDQATVRRALQRAEFVVVQETHAGTATNAYAHLLLPATGWGEKDGTVTNSERRISRVRPSVPGPGQARHDWAIGVDFARRLEHRLRPGRPTLFPYPDAESVWTEHRASTAGRDLDITGLSYPLLDSAGPQQWPMPAGAAAGLARLYTDGLFATPDGRARFHDAPYRPVAEPRDARFPFSLNTGRLRDHWHGMSRTGTLGRLFGHVAEPAIELHAQDMARLRLADGDLVRVMSRRGVVVLPAQSGGGVAPAQAFIAMHWGAEFLSGRGADGTPLAGINALTSGTFCAQSKQPELKHTAVRIERAALPWRLLAAAWLPVEGAAAARNALRALMAAFDFATVVPFGQHRDGLLLRAASAQAPGADVLQAVEDALGLAAADRSLLRYADPARGQRRTMRLLPVAVDARLDAFVLAGDASAEAWVLALLQDEQPARALSGQLLTPGPRRGAGPRRRQVCNCFDVDEASIAAELSRCAGAGPERLAQLLQRLHCGTQCGSCLPALRVLVESTVATP